MGGRRYRDTSQKAFVHPDIHRKWIERGQEGEPHPHACLPETEQVLLSAYRQSRAYACSMLPASPSGRGHAILYSPGGKLGKSARERAETCGGDVAHCKATICFRTGDRRLRRTTMLSLLLPALHFRSPLHRASRISPRKK